MSTDIYSRQLLATVDVRELNTLWWGPLRQMFPAFVEEIEQGRYLKKLLETQECRTVQIESHRGLDGRGSKHVFDVIVLEVEENPSTA